MKISNIEIEEEMLTLLLDRESLREKIRVGKLAEEKLRINNTKLQAFTRVYNDDLGIIRIEVRQLKHHIADNEMDEIVETIGKIEDLLGGR